MVRQFLSIAIVLSPILCAEPFYDRDEFRHNWRVTKAFTLAVADAMPAERYQFRPTPEEMTFGDLMIHIAYANAVWFQNVTGAKYTDAPPPEGADKATALRWLNETFDFCLARLDKITPEQAAREHRSVWPGRTSVTGREILLSMLLHTAHHRGQAEVYLRLNHIRPPVYTY